MNNKLTEYNPRLKIIILMHPKISGREYLEGVLYSTYSRDINNPLSRGLGIPVFFLNPFEGEVVIKIDLDSALHTVVIPFIDSKMVNDKKWRAYLEEVWEETRKNTRHRMIPVNVDGRGYKISSLISRVHFLRYHKYPSNYKSQYLKINILHEICRVLKSSREGPDSTNQEPTKLFLSHSKDSGEDIAKSIRDFIYKETSIQTFFDVSDIRPGDDFAEAIMTNIRNSCLIAINTDDYSSREWCRRELLKAKECGCPIIVVDCLAGYVDRLFPYIGNAPVIRWSEKINIIDIISVALQETLRNLYNNLHLEYITNIWSRDTKNFQWFRAPEILTCVNLHHHLDSKLVNIMMYPDPPLGLEELALLADSFPQLSFTTPTQFLSYKEKGDEESKSNIIGFSIAESSDLPINGLTSHHLVDAFVEFSRYILSTNAYIAYGGDLRQHGFTQILFDLTRNYSKTDEESKSRIINFLAWPFHKKLIETEEADLSDIAEIRKINLPNDLMKYNDLESDPSTIEGRYFFSRSLTKMRTEANNEISCRILLGGKRENFRGKYPGLLEEAYLAIANRKPIYIVGAFGGSAYDISRAISGTANGIFLDSHLTENEKNFIEYYNKQTTSLNEERIDYQKIFQNLKETGFEGLENGLTKEENERLFASNHIFEIISLVLKGLKKIELI